MRRRSGSASASGCYVTSVVNLPDFHLEGQVDLSAELIQTADASGGLNFDSLMTSEFALNGGRSI